MDHFIKYLQRVNQVGKLGNYSWPADCADQKWGPDEFPNKNGKWRI
jgi:hypothetical protein